ncbi:SDR family NAD(P)-dependent oxidoreductase [uncultured Sphingorhabdus sp.]|uniref:SDR family NAD(P)-dependent oxidoreductase n=1 Tax=uncultured Sphingorhabdus sp. TaxID=1686106 RepID=UPI002634472A|nr:SDR family oxidoreductase [uncultured Sphingorhabdus sp.]HMS20087.1 SDR family oxidoreductase [Sphingorhabdus sp.]
MQLKADLSGKRALVTGASSEGFGAHFARVLAASNAEVVVAARRREPLEALVAEIRKSGGMASAVTIDVSNNVSVEQAIADAGPLDIIVNNAGVEKSGSVLGLTEDDYDYVMDINLKGVWQVATAAARQMRDRGQGGSIVNIASITGHQGMKGAAPYSVSKAGVLHMTRQLAQELARYDIRVNSISPGYFATDLNREFLASEAGEAMRKRIAMRRFGAFPDLDGALLLLASDASRFMTGSDIIVDGGHLLYSL